MAIKYKVASTQEEFEQIHHLNYKTFVDEIPQHQKNDDRKLVDRFHEQNSYLIACDGTKVIGMIAVRDQRPFSLDEKIINLDDYLPGHTSVCELRLLAVEKKYRYGRIFFGMAQYLAAYCLQHGYDLAIMSGTVRQLKLYNQMGFVPFADLVGTEEAVFQPMFLTRDTFEASLAARLQPCQLSFLPGPVPIRKEVAASLQGDAISHRSSFFRETMNKVRQGLCNMTGSSHVEVLLGTGTLANDCIAAQIGLRNEPGLVLSNGEFGERLIDHASRAGLEFDVVQKQWSEPFGQEEVNNALQTTGAKWLWAVYGETSTGMLNDINMFKAVCSDNKTILCLDAVSALGAVPVDLDRVYLASGVSGKGIGGYTGLCFVFHHEEILPSATIPRYLDLGLYQGAGSIPFSHSSNLLQALLAALEYNGPEKYEGIRSNYALLRREIEKMGYEILVPELLALPFIITILIPSDQSSLELGDIMASCGFKLHYESCYLVERNWLQISVIGRDEQEIRKMIATLKRIKKKIV